MDKLQPIIKQRFWILLGLVAPLTIFGYYKANGALRAATEERIGQLDGLQVPSGNEENPRWSQGLSQINADYEKSVNAEIVRIWERQQARMTWPAPMQQYLPENYRDPFSNQAGVVYANLYPELLRELHASIEPVTVSPQGKISATGKVLFEEKQIPRSTFEGRLSIPSEMIWDAQEDIWQLRLLFDAIRKMNRPAENAAKSAVRAVYKVELWGGSGESSVKGSAVGGSGEGLSGMGEMGGMMEMQMQMRGGLEQGMGGGGQTVKVAFNPEEEFGTGGQPGGAGGIQRGRFNMGSMAMGPADGAGESLSTTTQPTKTLRYVKDSDSVPYHERGFYLSVLIDQRRIADFLVELSNSDWPIRIGRFHVGPNPNGGKGLPSSGMGGIDGMMLGMDGGGFGGSADVAAQMEMMMNLGAEAGGNPFDDSGLEMEGGAVATPTLNPTGEAVGLLQQFDLVQLDLVGYITFYKRPTPEVLAAVQQATQGAAAPAAVEAAPAAEDAGAPIESPPATDAVVDPQSGAAGGATEPPAESTDPAQPGADPTAPPPADSSPGEAPAADGSSPPDSGSEPPTATP